VQASAEVNMTQAFIAMHWGSEFLSGLSTTGERIGGVNAITTRSYCPTSKQPELKHAAVKILKADIPWTLLAVAWLPQDRAWQAREQLKALMDRFPFTSCVPFSDGVTLSKAAQGEERHGILLRAASYEQPEDAQTDRILAEIENILDIGGPECLRYADKKRGQRRAVKIQRMGGEAQIEGFLLAGDTSSQAWITAMLQEQRDATRFGRMLLVPGMQPPVAVAAKGAQVCSCFGVAEPDIDAFLQSCTGDADQRLSSLQQGLKCGTNCGSCLPQLKKMVRLAQPSAQAQLA
jgi:assimilatory nitrate reductase catalytic subunit